MEFKKYIPFQEKETNNIKVEVYYEKGGANYFSGGYNVRGYKMSFRCVNLEQKDGYSTESFAMFGFDDAVKPIAFIIEQTERLNKKKLEAFAAKLLPAAELLTNLLIEGKKEEIQQYINNAKA